MPSTIQQDSFQPTFPRLLPRANGGDEASAAQLDHIQGSRYLRPMSAPEPENPAADRVLVERALRGEQGAIEILVTRIACVSRFLRTLNRKLRRPVSEVDLEDVIQSAMTTIWSKLDRYVPERRLEAWMYGICSLEIRKGIDARQRRERVELTEDAEDWPGGVPTRLDPALEYEALHRSLESLRPEASKVIRMVHFEDMSFHDVAVALGLNRNTVKTFYYRGLQVLRDALARSFPEEASQ